MISITSADNDNQKDQICSYCWERKATVIIEVALDYDLNTQRNKISTIPCCDSCHLILRRNFHSPKSLVTSLHSRLICSWSEIKMARRRKGKPPPPQTITIHVTRESYDTLIKTKLHDDEPTYMVLNRLIGKYNDLKNVSFQEYQHFEEELEKYKEYRDLAEYEINRLKQKNRELESENEQLEQQLIFENKQEEQQIHIRIQN